MFLAASSGAASCRRSVNAADGRWSSRRLPHALPDPGDDTRLPVHRDRRWTVKTASMGDPLAPTLNYFERVTVESVAAADRARKKRHKREAKKEHARVS